MKRETRGVILGLALALVAISSPHAADPPAAPQATPARAGKQPRLPAGGEWTDLTNAPQKIVGSWQGGRHRTQYFADGTFVTDPHLVPDAPRGRWRVEGDRLIETFPQANITTTHNILLIDARTLVIRNTQGQTFKKTRITK